MGNNKKKTSDKSLCKWHPENLKKKKMEPSNAAVVRLGRLPPNSNKMPALKDK